MNSLADDVTAMFTDTLFLVFIQFFRIDWFAIFQNNVCFLNEWYMTFKDIAGIIQTHRYDRTTGLLGNLKGTVVERKQR